MDLYPSDHTYSMGRAEMVFSLQISYEVDCWWMHISIINCILVYQFLKQSLRSLPSGTPCELSLSVGQVM